MNLKNKKLCTHFSNGWKEHGMTTNLKHGAVSRRALLWLPILGVGCAAALTLGVSEAVATPVTDAAGKAKDLAEANAADKAKDLAETKAAAEGKKAERVEGKNPDDTLEISAQTRGTVRRTARRTTRQVRRTTRRVRRVVR
jgi:hypothetical protein